jgi:hypothetical protein
MQHWVEIRRQVAIAGRVIDQEDGGPIAGAQITITTPQAAFNDWLALKALAYGPGWDSLTVRADRALSRDDGRFCFIDVPDGSYTVSAEWIQQGNRYGIAASTATVARDGDGTLKPAAVDLALPPTRVTGRVEAKAVVVPMARVRLKGGSESTFTDGQGVYVLSAIEPGQRIVRVQADGLTAMESSVNVSGRGQSVTVNISLS